MNKKTHLILFILVVLMIPLLSLGGCNPPAKVPHGDSNTGNEVTDPWYTDGFVKGTKDDIDETKMLLDLINSFSNQIKNASTQKVNNLNPCYSLDFSFDIIINSIQVKIEFKVNVDIENFTNSAIHLAIYKNEGGQYKLYLQANIFPIEPLGENSYADMFISLKGEGDSYTKVTMKVFSELFFKFFPLTLGARYESTIDIIASYIGSALDFDTQPKYEYKVINNTVTRHYNVLIDLKKTIKRLMKSFMDLPVVNIPMSELLNIKNNLEFFFSNVLGVDISTEESIENTMPPIQVELDFITEKGMEGSFKSNNSVLSKLTLNCVVSEDQISEKVNKKFKGERFEYLIDWDKISIKRILNFDIPVIDDFKKYDPENPDEDAYIHYNFNMPLALVMEAKYEGAFVEESQNLQIGFKYNYYETSGSDDEFCFRVFDDDDETILAISYADNQAYISGVSEEPFSFPFSSWEFINGEKGKVLSNDEDLLFKAISYLLGAISLNASNEVCVAIETQYLSEILDAYVSSFEEALEQAYRAADGAGKLIDILSGKGIDIDSFLYDKIILITIKLDSDYLKLYDSIPGIENLIINED